MTKLEIAAMAMQGILAGKNTSKMTDQGIAKKSRRLAECLENEMSLPNGSRVHDHFRANVIGKRPKSKPKANPEAFE